MQKHLARKNVVENIIKVEKKDETRVFATGCFMVGLIDKCIFKHPTYPSYTLLA